MTGKCFGKISKLRTCVLLIAALTLSSCDEDGNFAFPAATGDGTTNAVGTGGAPTVERDVEMPDIFQVTDRGLWDGRPSLGGIWVAHPDVAEPERVIIRNLTNGKSVIGALFRRERDNPGPPLQISSDAAEALGILAGTPTEVSVTALRREEVTIEPEQPAEDATVEDLAAPAAIAATALDPIAGAAAAIDAADVATPASTQTTEPPAPAIDNAYVQVGVFSVERNANKAADLLRAEGLTAEVIALQAGGRTVWRVVVGPAATVVARDAALATTKGLGFSDAFVSDK